MKNTLKKNNKKKNRKFSSIIILFPVINFNKSLKIKKTFKRRKNYYGGNNTPIDAAECLRQGFCYGEYSSKIPSDKQEYAVTEFSGNSDTNTIGDLHQIRESNKNLSVGDSNYTPSTPPKGAEFIEK